MQKSVDVVIIWVDGSDREWQKSKAKYSKSNSLSVDDSVARYRDWDNIKYIFRGIEKFMPWVRKVHFVTCGHVPEWLNLDCEKLNFVKHDDFIPKKYLPTFSANPIELNLHRIKGLSEKFVFFNDDMFVTRPISESILFKHGKPRMEALLNRIDASKYNEPMAHIGLNDVGVINSNFNKKDFINKNFFKLYNPTYGVFSNVRNIILSIFPRIPGFYWHHYPSSLIKKTFNEIWAKAPDALDNTCRNKFRSVEDVNQYLVCSWQVMSGNFLPRNVGRKCRVFFNIEKEIGEATKSIVNMKYNFICINDSIDCINFELTRDTVNSAFNQLLPEKSMFEK